jgi:CDP-diacylglycerol--glycerol-3-phosphate 3-phosphatidyltransferase
MAVEPPSELNATPTPPPNSSGDASGESTGHDELTFNTTPNWLTMIRIAFVPIVVGLLFIKTPTADLAAALAFTVASITDYFDGYLARTRKVVTVYGKLLDPLADKFLVVSALIMLQELGRIHPVVVILLICRELAITGLRALASAEGVIIDASGGGKWKTGTQMVAIPLIMACDQNRKLLGLPLYPVGMVLLYISLAISLWSAKSYIVDFFKAIKEQRKHRQMERRLAREARRAARAARLAAKARKSQT